MRTNQGSITERAATVGLAFHMDKRSRTWNTFDAHRLLHWAGTVGQAEQTGLKKALLVDPAAR